MKTKHEILTALAHSGEEKILLASLLGKEQAFYVPEVEYALAA